MLTIIENIDNCLGCSACKAVCPNNCISMLPNLEGFLQPIVEETNCSGCNMCTEVCPAINPPKNQTIKEIYYGWNKDESIRRASASGGAFSAFAEKVLEKGGVVFGAVYDNKLQKVIHVSSEKLDYCKQRKSKYVQSDLQDTFLEAKQYLNSNRFVLFSGTPCQIHGLKNFLGDKYKELLITCDFICGGNPTMKILNEHLSLLENTYNSKVINFDFRSKDPYGWSTLALQVAFENKKIYNFPVQIDYYFLTFLTEKLFLKESCLNCIYRKRHVSDIIMADFWGFDKYKPEINDEKGISLVMANSLEGQKFISTISDKLILNPIEEKYVAYCFSDRVHCDLGKRSEFFKEYHQFGYESAIKRFVKINKSKALLGFHVKRILKSLKPL